MACTVLCKKEYHLHPHKKFRGKKFSPCPVLCNKNISITYLHIKYLGKRSSCPAQFPVIKYHLHPYKIFRAVKFLPCPVLCKEKISSASTEKNLGGRSSRPAQFSVIKISFTYIYYMACVCSQYNACSD